MSKSAKSEALNKFKKKVVKGKTLGDKESEYEDEGADKSKEKGEKESKKKMREAE